MLDALSAFSLYRQLEGLENTLTHVKGDVVSQFLAAYRNQNAFNSMLKQVVDGCNDVPAYLQTLDHIKPVEIPRGSDHAAYPHFFAQVQMLKQAVRALLELTLSAEEKNKWDLYKLLLKGKTPQDGAVPADF